MATMEDIARRVGVHRVTVSNVLNGKFKAERSDARKRAEEILRVAEELGFRPSAAAIATRTGRTNLIGILTSTIFANSVHIPEFQHGLLQGAKELGLCLVTDQFSENADGTVKSLPRLLREDMADGLLINYAFGTPAAVREVIERSKIPTLWVNRKRPNNCVHPADEEAAHDATRYMIECGHRDIAFLTDEGSKEINRQEPHYSYTDRRAGYQRAMAAAGLSPRVMEIPPSPPHKGDVHRNHFLNIFTGILRASNRPRAILCGNDTGRVMLLAAAIVGLRVPEDLSVFTFDNDAGADEKVAIDRVLVPNYPMGREAIRELNALIAEPTKPRPARKIPFEFQTPGTVARLTS
jgi:LacI family transcriptional regulator